MIGLYGMDYVQQTLNQNFPGVHGGRARERPHGPSYISTTPTAAFEIGYRLCTGRVRTPLHHSYLGKCRSIRGLGKSRTLRDFVVIGLTPFRTTDRGKCVEGHLPDVLRLGGTVDLEEARNGYPLD